MSKGSSSPTQTTQSTSTTTLPQWVTDAAQKNLNKSYEVADNLLGPYTGQRVAGMTDGANADIAALQANVGSANPAFNFAQSTLAGLQGYQPSQVNPGSIAGTDLSKYMNPFTSDVINSGLKAIDMQRLQAQNANADQAISQKAFGGSRQGVQEGVTNAAASMQAGQLASQLGLQNFQNAEAMAGQDIATNLQGQVANQNAEITGAGLNKSAADSATSTAAQQQNSLLQSLMGALQGQTMVQGQNQSQLSAAQQQYQEQQQFPIQQLQIPASILSATPYGYSTSGTQTTTQSGGGNGLMSGIGGAASALGILGSMFGSNGAFPMVGAASILSDRTMKTDIEKLGKDPETGLDMFAYRYKGDPKSYPKVVGPMAQDIAKAKPGAVRKIGGRMVVDAAAMPSMLSMAG